MNLTDHDERGREYPQSVYFVDAVTVGRIACYVPGVKLIDFYQTSPVLAKDSTPERHGEK